MFPLSFYFSRFEPKIFIHEYVMLSRIIRIMCKMLFIYSFIVDVSQVEWAFRMHMHKHACIRVSVCSAMRACVRVHIFVRYKLEHTNIVCKMCHSWLICIHLYVVKVNTDTHSHCLHTMETAMHMHMLNAQIALDGFENESRKFSQCSSC